MILQDVIGYYSEYENTENTENTNKTNKKMKIMPKGNLEDKLYDIFENIREKSDIDNIGYV